MTFSNLRVITRTGEGDGTTLAVAGTAIDAPAGDQGDEDEDDGDDDDEGDVGDDSDMGDKGELGGAWQAPHVSTKTAPRRKDTGST